MRSPPDTKHQEFDRSLSDVFKDFVVRPADSHIGSWITEFFGRLRHECVKGAEEAILKIGETIWMLDYGLLNHIEHINLGRENLSECNRIGRSIGGRLSKVGRKKNPLERERL
jgi:hypothetical protein